MLGHELIVNQTDHPAPQDLFVVEGEGHGIPKYSRCSQSETSAR
jgi:hypothetical protein